MLHSSDKLNEQCIYRTDINQSRAGGGIRGVVLPRRERAGMLVYAYCVSIVFVWLCILGRGYGL